MTTETPTFNAPTREQLRTAAQAALDAALAALAEVKKSVDNAKQVKIAAQAIIDGAKADIMRAEANVNIAKANLLDFGPAPTVARNADDPSILDTVLKALREAGDKKLTVDEILESIGNTTNRDNLGAYLARWAKTGVILKGEKTSRLEPARFYAPGIMPSFLAEPAAAPSFLAAPVETPVTDVLGEDFPGVEALAEAGITSRADLVGKTAADLVAIPGIGAKTADKILAAMAG